MTRHPLWPPLLLGLFALVSMGFFALAKIAFAAGVPPLAFTFWQAAGGALTSLAWCWIRGLPVGWDRRHLRFYAIAGLVGVVAPNALVFAALPHVGSGPVGLVYALSPVLTYGLALATGWERHHQLDGLPGVRPVGMGEHWGQRCQRRKGCNQSCLNQSPAGRGDRSSFQHGQSFSVSKRVWMFGWSCIGFGARSA